MNNNFSLFERFCHFRISWCAALVLVVLTWSNLAFCGEIHDAAKSGDLEKVKALVKDNPALVFSQDNNGGSPLAWAALQGHKDVVELLLANKADVNAKDYNGDTPLHFAADKGRRDVAELLLANGADANAKDNAGSTPLHSAALEGRTDVVKLLLASKADINARDNGGHTPLHSAANNGYKDVAELLLASNAEVNAKDNNGCTPLYLAAYHGYDLENVQIQGNAVSFPAGCSPIGVVKLLLANKAEVNAKDNKGHTALLAASATGHTDTVKLLLANKAEVNAKDNDGDTPLLAAAANGIPDVVKLLLLNKADVNAKDNNGNAPLELAKDGSDSNERTAKDMAKYKNYEEVMELLRHPPTPTTVILMTVSQFVPSHYISLLGVISAMVILGFICFRSESRARAWRWIQMHLPLFGKMNRKP